MLISNREMYCAASAFAFWRVQGWAPWCAVSLNFMWQGGLVWNVDCKRCSIVCATPRCIDKRETNGQSSGFSRLCFTLSTLCWTGWAIVALEWKHLHVSCVVAVVLVSGRKKSICCTQQLLCSSFFLVVRTNLLTWLWQLAPCISTVMPTINCNCAHHCNCTPVLLPSRLLEHSHAVLRHVHTCEFAARSQPLQQVQCVFKRPTHVQC
jgi:hypothetical protein